MQINNDEHSQVQIGISCQNLPNLDTFSKSDPIVKVYMKSLRTGNVDQLIGQTEEILDNLNPKFTKQFLIDYYFEEEQLLTFVVFDKDNTNEEFIGQATVSLGNIVSSPGGAYRAKLQQKNGRDVRGNIKSKPSVIRLTFTELTGSANVTVNMQMSARALPKMDFFGKSDGYVEIYRRGDDNTSWSLVAVTEVIPSNLNPSWKPMQMKGNLLLNGNKNRVLKFVVWDHNKNSKPDYIGEVQAIASSLKPGCELKLVNAKKPSKGQNGFLRFPVFQFVEEASFLKYLAGGMELNLSVAIDFTGSNGNAGVPGTLHYHTPTQYSLYEQALSAVGNILAAYDHDNLYPAYGFGAKKNLGQSPVSHCFALNNDEKNPYCHGVQGILQAYRAMTPTLKFSGPTYFQSVISNVVAHASRATFSDDEQEYHVLLILTDGVINDMQNTVQQIVQGSFLPLSIIIVGIGNANFDSMDELDCDTGMLRDHTNRTAARDIVQFVPFNKFQNNPALLAQHTLHELPQQVVQFAKTKGISPMLAGQEDMTELLLRNVSTAPVPMPVPVQAAPHVEQGQQPVPDVPPPAYL